MPTSRQRRRASPRSRRWPTWPAASATGRCAPWARIGGSLANNDPAACYPAAVLALNATVQTTQRKIAADDFFQGMFTTALEDGELITAVSFPMPKRAAYIKFKQPASRFALIGVFVAQTDSGVRVAVTGGGNGVFRHQGWSRR
jgi:carbon-monoxide dehydrogenase medium subunit